ncbi:hypothetical protein AaE_014010 [Aphanomyces astaci]|uniref:Uncharacterized protein n=1 Tax=Aphanomyces astaci TaxID=112090 RepID=A0A6A4Z8U6_APHAT|nr:hypothetical protein AaE_014010 [Aphanomyces astaci]
MSAIYYSPFTAGPHITPQDHKIQSAVASPMANVAAMIGRLEDLVVSDQVFLDNSFTLDGDTIDQQKEVTDSTCPIIDNVLEEAGDEGFRIMTNFTTAKFDVLWDVVHVSLKSRWTDGRGFKCKTSCKDALFLTLAVLKHYQSWEKNAVDSGFCATDIPNSRSSSVLWSSRVGLLVRLQWLNYDTRIPCLNTTPTRVRD